MKNKIHHIEFKSSETDLRNLYRHPSRIFLHSDFGKYPAAPSLHAFFTYLLIVTTEHTHAGHINLFSVVGQGTGRLLSLSPATLSEQSPLPPPSWISLLFWNLYPWFTISACSFCSIYLGFLHFCSPWFAKWRGGGSLWVLGLAAIGGSRLGRNPWGPVGAMGS